MKALKAAAAAGAALLGVSLLANEALPQAAANAESERLGELDRRIKLRKHTPLYIPMSGNAKIQQCLGAVKVCKDAGNFIWDKRAGQPRLENFLAAYGECYEACLGMETEICSFENLENAQVSMHYTFFHDVDHINSVCRFIEVDWEILDWVPIFNHGFKDGKFEYIEPVKAFRSMLIDAIRDKDLDGAERVITAYEAKPEYMNAKDTYGATPLHDAVRENATGMAKLLLQHRADVNAEDNNCRTSLHWAASQTSIAMAEILLEHGADVNAKGSIGRTPLHCVALANRNECGPFSAKLLEFAKLLLEHSADVNAEDNNGRTPLTLADIAEEAEMSALLRRHGAE